MVHTNSPGAQSFERAFVVLAPARLAVAPVRGGFDRYSGNKVWQLGVEDAQVFLRAVVHVPKICVGGKCGRWRPGGRAVWEQNEFCVFSHQSARYRGVGLDRTNSPAGGVTPHVAWWVGWLVGPVGSHSWGWPVGGGADRRG